MHGDFTTCMEMSGNGYRIASMTIMRMLPSMELHGKRKTVVTVWVKVEAGWMDLIFVQVLSVVVWTQTVHPMCLDSGL
jgi:hypothetical protein